MTKGPHWPAVYDLMKAGEEADPLERCVCVCVCVCAGMAEIEGELIEQGVEEEGERVYVCVCVADSLVFKRV